MRKHLPAEEQKLVCKGMCHDIMTADRFYTVVPDIQDVFCVRDSLEPSNQSSASEDADSRSPTSDNIPET